MGVAYDAVQIDMGVMGHKDPEFIRDVNPFGKHAWGGGEVGERKVSILGLVDPQFASGLIAAPRLRVSVSSAFCHFYSASSIY